MSDKLFTIDDLYKIVQKPVIAKVELPSRGKFYRADQTDFGVVQISPLDVHVEKLMSGSLGSIDVVIDGFLEYCLKSNISPDDLLVVDRFFLLLALRANSYGELYPVQVSCTNCKKQGQYNIHFFNDLKIKYTDPTEKEPFFVTLPISKMELGVRLLRGKDLKEIERFTQNELKAHPNTKGDPGYIYSLAKQLVSVNGCEFDNLLTKLALIENLSVKDLSVLKDFYNSIGPAVEGTITKVCNFCSKEFAFAMPITAEFFRFKSSTEGQSTKETTKTNN